MGICLSSELNKMKGGDEEEWRPTSAALLTGTSWLFNTHNPMTAPRVMEQPLP